MLLKLRLRVVIQRILRLPISSLVESVRVSQSELVCIAVMDRSLVHIKLRGVSLVHLIKVALLLLHKGPKDLILILKVLNRELVILFSLWCAYYIS